MQGLLRHVMRGTALRLCAVVWLFGYVLVDVAAAVQGRSIPGAMFLANVPLLLLGIAQSVALGLLLDRLSGRPTIERWGLVMLAGLIAGVVQTAADDVWLRLVALTLAPSWQSWAVGWQPQRLFTVAILYIWTLYLTVTLVWAARTADSAKMNEARAAAFEAAASRAEAAALRLQLNPHFLFNTLNGIASLVVRKRDDQAEEMIGRLADFLRSSLVSNPTALVPLAQEMETIRAYLIIEEARFGDRLRVEFQADPGLSDLSVPNFILQPLVENAIKHGTATAGGTATIRVDAVRREGEALLAVTNWTGAVPGAPLPLDASEPAPAPVGRRGIGLNNTRQRLAAQYGTAAWLACQRLGNGYRAEIGLPLRFIEGDALTEVAA